MSWELVFWLAIFIVQSGLLGRTMYVLICLTDLENDFINPFDLSNKVNSWVVAEYAAHFAATAALLGTGRWFLGLLYLGTGAYLAKLYVTKRHRIEATDAFKVLPAQKRQRIGLLAFYVAAFVFVVYRLIERTLHSLLTPEGRHLAKKLIHEAAASLNGY